MLDKIMELFSDQKEVSIEDFDVSKVENGKHYIFSSLLPYLSYIDKLFFNKTSVGFILETIPLNGIDERIEKEIANILEHVVPLGSNIQIMLYASNKTADILENWVQCRSQSLNVIQESSEKRKEFLEDNTQNVGIKNFRLIISYSQELKDTLNPVEQTKIRTIQQQLKNVFASLNLPIKAFEAEDLIRLLDDILNMNNDRTPSRLSWNKSDIISNQVISPDTDTDVEDNGIYQRNKTYIARTYNARNFPYAWSLASTLEILGEDILQLSSSFIIHVPVHIINDSSTKAKMFAKAVRAEDQASSSFTKWMPSLGNELEEWRLIRKNFEENCRIVKTSYNIMIFSKPENIDIEEQKLVSLFRHKGWTIVPNTYTHLPTLLSILPMAWGEKAFKDMSLFKKVRTTISKEVSNLLPIVAEWKGTQTPGMLFVGRKGQVFNWHNFDNDAGNYNVCVVGRSGSGKSVFMQEMVSSTIGMGGRVFVIDVGRSFEKATSLYDGKFIEFTLSKPICINPFSSLTEDLGLEEIENSLSMLKSIISLMAAPQDGTNDIENSLLEKAIKGAYNIHRHETRIDDVITELEQDGDDRASTLATQLYSYSSHGIYGKFFSGQSDLSFKETLISIEFEELRQKKDLRAVVLQTVILQITNQMILGKRGNKPFNIVIDEAWDMLKGGSSGEFVETLARTLRKFNGSLVIGTQSVNDFYSSPAAQAAFDNSDWLCLLSQKKESIAALKSSNRLVMNDHMEDTLKTVHTKHGKYAEVMIYGPDGYTVGKLLLDPFSQLLYSTKAEDYKAVLDLKEQGLSIKDAINQLLDNKKQK